MFMKSTASWPVLAALVALAWFTIVACDAPADDDAADDDSGDDDGGCGGAGGCEPYAVEACISELGCDGERACGADCTWGACENSAWECEPGQTESCASGACDGLRTCDGGCGWGTCLEACPGDEICCSAGCVDASADPSNCGACDRVCEGNYAGVCYDGTCCDHGVRNGSEICDDEAFSVPDPYVRTVLVCVTDNGGVGYVATDTGPQMSDGVRRCQGWEEAGMNAWDYLNYLVAVDCTAAGLVTEVDLSPYSGGTLYIGAHDQPTGGGHMTEVCLGVGP